jgi:transcriptional regulator of arginine metabolism
VLRTRDNRQDLILGIIRQMSIRTQDQLLAELRRSGVVLTQATLSRELKALGVAKGPDGRGGYRYLVGGSGEGPASAMGAFVRSVARAGNLVVVKTPPGNAQGVARAIDASSWTEVLGTIGGDDTILVICHDEQGAVAVVERLQLIAPA